MKELILLASQHAGVTDVFHELVPKWAFAALFGRILGSDNSHHVQLSSTLFQEWLLEEKLHIPPRLVLDFFMRSPSTETVTKAEFVNVCPPAL
jgi:hypothetical protein